MVFRFLLILFIINLNTGYTNIIYDKKDISITEIEINDYLKIYKNNFGVNLKKNTALKEIFIMKKTINNIESDNPEFIFTLDEKIKFEFGQEVFDNEILRDFLRMNQIKNEFIIEYYKSEFGIKDLKIIFSKFLNIKLPISENNCLTIKELYDLKNNQFFIESYLENIKKNQNNFKAKIDNKTYNVCMSDQNISFLENTIYEYVEDLVKKDFEKFIYGKIN